MGAAVVAGLVAGGAALASGAASLIGAADSNRANRNIARETNAANAQLQKDQNQWNLEQWQRNNEYNSPQNQVKRMREAGLNPFMSTAGVAANNTSSAPAPSAPYAPTVKPDYVSPFSAVAPSVNNIGNDFMSTYMNMKMQNAQIEKVQADTDKAKADAGAVSGYQKDQAVSEIDKNAATARLAGAQTELTRVNSSIASTFGGQQAAADLANSVQTNLESKSRTINNEHMAKQIVAQTVETYAKARNLNLQSNQLEAITNLLVSKMKLENESLRIANDMGGTNASILRTYGHEKARLGNQALHASTRKANNEANILRKQDQFFWWKQGLDYGGSIAKTITDFIPTKSAVKSGVKAGMGAVKNSSWNQSYSK